MPQFLREKFTRLRALVSERRRLLFASAAAAVFGMLAGVAAFHLMPGLTARSFLPAWIASPPSPGDIPGPSARDNRLMDRQTRRLFPQGPGAGADGARQLAQAVLATIRNFYVDAERVSDQNLASLLVKVIRKKSSQIQASSDTSSITVAERGKSSRFVLNAAGMVDAVTAASVLMAQQSSDQDPVQKCREILNLLVAELDPHSSVMSPSAYNELRQGTEGSFGGLGVLVGIRDRVLTVIKPLPNSPASRAGIMAGDRVVRINNQPTFGMALEDLMDFMRGSPGTHVTMRVLRDGTQSPLDIVLKREVIQVDSVTSRAVDDPRLKILHIAVETFSAKTSREILGAMKSFKRTHGNIDGLILDLRSNPGGLLDQAVQVTDLFLEDGIIVATRGRREEVEFAGKGYDEVEFPLVVLIDEESASASEIVAGALQDQGRAVVVGRPSFGKGSVQTVFELPYEAALKLTIARYFTPANRSIQNVGILPDLWIQTMLDRGENMNILGSARYRNEGFLLHRLDEKSEARQHLMTLDERMSESCCAKAYIMAPKMEDGDADEGIEVAKMVISAAQIDPVQPKPEPVWTPGRTRSIVLDESVRAKIGRLAGQATGWLKSRFGISWDTPNGKGQFLSLATGPANVRFQVESLSGDSTAAGEESRFLWTLVNQGSQPLHRVSVYLRASGVAGETQEVLIGSVAAGETRSGSISARAPFSVPEESWDVDVGIAIDAWPMATMTRHFQLPVQVKDRPQLNLVTSISGEKGGIANGALDPGEQADLHLVVTNDGRSIATGIELHVVNLSGGRVAMGEWRLPVTELAPGASTTIDVPISFNGNHAVHEIDIGVSVGAREMESPLVRQLTLPVSSIAGRVGSAQEPGDHK